MHPERRKREREEPKERLVSEELREAGCIFLLMPSGRRDYLFTKLQRPHREHGTARMPEEQSDRWWIHE